MRILVTGSSGYLGEALMISLHDSEHEAIGTDQNAGKYTQFTGDLADRAFVKKIMAGVEAVIHTATLHKPHVVTHSKQQFVDTNISGTLNLLEESVAQGIQAFLFTSTTSTFGDAMVPKPDEPAVWVTEDLVPRPKNIYGVTKTAAEDLCLLFHRNHDLPCLILRTSRFFAEEDDNPELRQAHVDINIKINELLYRRVDIADVVSAHLQALDRAVAIGFSKYIISATTPFTMADLALLNSNAPAVLQQRVPESTTIYEGFNWQMFPRIGRVYVNEKARQELDWQPKYDFRYALQCLSSGKDYRSPLTLQISPKRYHNTNFTDGPYPV